MIRTQIYLTDEQYQSLQRLVRRTGKSRSELIRNAVDHFLTRQNIKSKQGLRAAAGIWAKRKDLPDFLLNRKS